MLSPRALVRGNPARAKFAAENTWEDNSVTLPLNRCDEAGKSSGRNRQHQTSLLTIWQSSIRLSESRFWNKKSNSMVSMVWQAILLARFCHLVAGPRLDNTTPPWMNEWRCAWLSVQNVCWPCLSSPNRGQGPTLVFWILDVVIKNW